MDANKLHYFFLPILIIGVLFISFRSWNHNNHEKAISMLASGQGKDEVVKHCSRCHSVARITARSGDKKYWTNVILWMEKMQGMPSLAKKDHELIISYLSEHYGAASDKKN